MKGIIYTHEHMKIDLSHEKNDIDCLLDMYSETLKELKELKTKGVEKIIDLTNRGMGRDINYIINLEKESGIEILASTGYYKEPFLPCEVTSLSVDELTNIMIDEIEIGIDGSHKKAQIIGEIGTGFDIITPLEKKVFMASANASKKTGKFISTHTSLGKLGEEQLDILESSGANLEKVILGHTDLSNNLEYIEKLLKRGVYIAFDTIGKIKYLPDETRVEFIKTLCSRGWSNKIILSVDLTRRSHLKVNGGIGYNYLLDNFLPKLVQAGVLQEHIEKMLIENPKKILEV